MTRKKTASPDMHNDTAYLKNLVFKNHLHITGRVVGIAILSLVIFGGLGLILDNLLHTAPLFLILGVVTSFVVAQITTIFVLKHLINKRK